MKRTESRFSDEVKIQIYAYWKANRCSLKELAKLFTPGYKGLSTINRILTQQMKSK